MRDLSAFFDRFDGMKPTRDIEDAMTDDGLRDASESVLPLYLQMAERTGVDLDDLWQEQLARLKLLPDIVVARGLTTGRSVQDEMLGCIANVAVECFMAGVLWQQESDLPSLEDLEGGS